MLTWVIEITSGMKWAQTEHLRVKAQFLYNWYKRLKYFVLILGNHDMDEEDLYDDYDLDEDEDDEDDDFIDDSESNIDASKYIRKIFGYDRRKYVRMLVVLLRPRLVESSVIVCNYLRCAMR